MNHFTFLDYGIFAVYLLAVVCIGLLSLKGQKNVNDYLLAGRSMGFVLVGISVVAAIFSGITFLGSSGEVYAHDLSFVLYGLSFFIATPVTTIIFLPFFYRARFFTAYQYLEERFSVGVRTLASTMFVVRVLLWLALATYAPALALQQVTGIPLWITILITGVLTTCYTTLGGMKAVIRTDVMQFVVLFGGQILIVIVAILKIPGGLAGVYRIGLEGGKFQINWSLDPTARVTFWGLIIGYAFINLVQMVTDQVSVQRYMTATSFKEARRSLWLKLGLTLPVLALFYGTGVVLYAFYHTRVDPLTAGLIRTSDQILPYFVINELPRGLPGVLVAAIYAASMGVTSSGINALTTVTFIDFYQRLWRPNADTSRQVALARWLTVMYGAIVLGLAFFIQRLGTLMEASNKAIGLAGGPLLGLFLLGVLTRRANAKGALVGWVAGFAAVLAVCFATSVSFLWYAMTGCVVTMVVGLLASLLSAPPTPRQLDGLTFDTRYAEADTPI